MFQRFIHNRSTYLEQWVNEKGINYRRHTEEITSDVVFNHLLGRKTVSVFPIAPDNTVTWLCFDVDMSPPTKRRIKNGELSFEDALSLSREKTRQLAKTLFQIGIPFRVEYSGSKGYHVWVFFDKPVPTYKAYDLGNAIHVRLGVDEHVNVEVFPKHRSYDETPVGFALKMPLGVHQKTKTRCFFVNSNFEPHADQWHVLQTTSLLTENAIDGILKEYQVEVGTVSKPSYETQPTNFVCIATIMKEGANDGLRDEGIFQTACYLRMNNVPEDLAEGLLNDVNQKSNDPLPESVVDIKRKSAYAKGYYPNPCRNPMFDSICSSSCRRWQRKVEQRWTRYGKDAQSAIGTISRE